MSLKKKILAFLSSETPEVTKLAEEKLADGTVIIADNFEAGTPIFIKSQDEDGENVALPVGDYQLEDGRVLKVEVEGEIASLEDAKIEAEEEEKMEEVVYDENHMDAMHQAIADLTARIEALEGGHDMEEEEEYSEEKVEMSSEEEVQEQPEQPEQKEEVKEEEQVEEPKEEPKEEVKEEAPQVEEKVEEVVEEAAPIAHSPEVSDEKRVRFYFPKN